MKLKINMLFASLLFSGVVNAAIVNHGDNNTSGNNSVVIGNNNKGKWQSVAIGNENQAGDQAIALGSFSEADDRAIAIGRTAKATVNAAISIGNDSSANDWGSISLGDRAVSTHSKLTEDEYKKATNPNGPISNVPGSAIAIGQQTTAAGEHSVAIGGRYAATNADNATALGAGAQVTIDNSVALGALSKVGNNEIREGKSYSSGENVSGKAGVVSVGSKNNERVITNVKGGIEDTDAVNVLQLKSVEKNAQTANDRATNLETRADSSEQAIRDTQNAAQTANDRATNLETRADTSEQNIRDVQGAAQIANDRASSLETRADGVEAVNAQQDSTLADHDTRITSNTSALTTKVDKQVFADDQARQDAALKSETTTRTSQVAKLQSGVDQAQATGDYANSRIDVANQNIEANRQASIATNKRVAANTAQLANHEQRITTLEQNTSARFSDLNSKIDDNRKRASAGIAGVAAMANIPQVLEHQTFAIGAGAGNTDGESALAVGFSARASQNTVVKASVSNDTQHNFVVGAGVAFGW